MKNEGKDRPRAEAEYAKVLEHQEACKHLKDGESCASRESEGSLVC